MFTTVLIISIENLLYQLFWCYRNTYNIFIVAKICGFNLFVYYPKAPKNLLVVLTSILKSPITILIKAVCIGQIKYFILCIYS